MCVTDIYNLILPIKKRTFQIWSTLFLLSTIVILDINKDDQMTSLLPFMCVEFVISDIFNSVADIRKSYCRYPQLNCD